jgi:hypothetical protein
MRWPQALLAPPLVAVLLGLPAQGAGTLDPPAARAGAQPSSEGREGAGRGPAGATENRLQLASQTSWVGPGEELVLRLGVATVKPPEEVELAVAVYRRVRNRTDFAQTLEGRLPDVPLTVTPPTLLSELATDAAGAVVVRLPVQDPDQPPDRTRLRLGEEGVYPVRVEVRNAGGGPAVAALVTHLVYTTPPKEGGFPLKVALVLPVHAPPALQPDGKRELSAQAADELAELVDAVRAYPLVPLNLLPTPETLDALETSAADANRETLAELAASTAGRQVVGGTYVPVDLRDIADSRLDTERSAQLDHGTRAIERTLGTRVDTRTWVAAEPLDQEAVLQLRQQQLDRFVIPEAAMEPVDVTVTLAQPFELDVSAVRRPQVLAADLGLSSHFARTDDPVLAAHRLLADLAVVYGDSPSRSRVVVAMAPRSWDPTKAFLDAVLAGISTSAIVAGSTLDAGFADVRPATAGTNTPLVRRLVPSVNAASLPAGAISRARGRLAGFSSIIEAANPLDDALEELVLVAQGAELRPAQRARYLSGMNATIDSQIGLIQVPPNRSITLTARTGEIPITILSRAPYPVHVQLEVDSEKLEFPKGAGREVNLTRRNTTERFSVRARTSGTFPLRLRLVSPDGTVVLGRSRFTVRSTAASGMGILLSAGAGAFLLAWWARHHARGRRNRRLVPV